MYNSPRVRLFRILRVALLTLAIIGGAQWLRHHFTALESEQGVINAEIVQIRTPITGELEIGDLRPGMSLRKGDLLFTVKNPHFGERESVALYNGIQNMVETQRSELLGAKQNLESITIALARARRLYKSQLIARVQVEDEETRYAQAQKMIVAKTEQLASSEARASEMRKQMEFAKQTEVRMPVDGLVWSVAGKRGEQFDANKPVLEVINPAHIWVDAFFSERSAQDLQPGLSGEVRSLDSSASWPGRLRSMRAGVGRLVYDTSVAVPPPELAKRQIAVRVDADWEQPFGATEFFGVGRSVQVTFGRVRPERTVGDAIRERVERALGRDSQVTASASR